MTKLEAERNPLTALNKNCSRRDCYSKNRWQKIGLPQQALMRVTALYTNSKEGSNFIKQQEQGDRTLTKSHSKYLRRPHYYTNKETKNKEATPLFQTEARRGRSKNHNK
jgi:hypothetical protein